MCVIAITGGRYDRLGEEVFLSSHQIKMFVGLISIIRSQSSNPSQIIRLKHGCTKGTVTHIDRICRDTYGLFVEVLPFPILQTDGDRSIAPKIRNIRMIRNSHPKTELLVALPGNRGTAHATNVALKIPIPVWKWTGSIYHGRFSLIN